MGFKNLSLKWKFFVLSLISNLVASLLFSLYVYEKESQEIVSGIDKVLESSARATVQIIGSDFHDKYKSEESLDEETHKVFVAKISEFVNSLPEEIGLQYVYTMVLRGDKVYETLSSATPEEVAANDIDPFMMEYEDEDGKTAEALRGSEKVFTEIEDEFGHFRSVLIPITSAGGEKYLVGADIEISTLNEKLNALLVETAGISILILSTGIILSFFISLGIVKAIVLINDKLKNTANTLDLGAKVALDRKDEIGEIAYNIDALMERFAVTIKQSVENSEQNMSFTRDMSKTSSEISKRVGEESQIIANTTKVFFEISNALNNSVAHNESMKKDIEHSNESLEKAKKDIFDITDKIQNTAQNEVEIAQSLNALNQEAENIKTILNAISEIADQTNLLALNAAIEAARAGEHGRGFAVVSDEVRKLAEKTQKSLSEINATISSIVQSIRDTSGRMEENSIHISELADFSKEIEDSIGEAVELIGKSASLMLQNITEVEKIKNSAEGIVKENEALNAISGINTAAVKEISVSVQKLNTLSANLNAKLSEFKV